MSLASKWKFVREALTEAIFSLDIYKYQKYYSKYKLPNYITIVNVTKEKDAFLNMIS